MLGNREFTVDDFVIVENGVKVKMQDNTTNKVGFAIDSKTKKEAIFTLEDCEQIILRCRKI